LKEVKADLLRINRVFESSSLELASKLQNEITKIVSQNEFEKGQIKDCYEK